MRSKGYRTWFVCLSACLSVYLSVCLCVSDALLLGHGKLTRGKEGTNGFGATLRKLL